MLQRGRLEAGENKGRFDRLECGARRQRSPRGSFTGKPELLRGRLRRRRLGGRVQYVLNGCDAGDGLFAEDAQFQLKGASEFAIEIDGAAAHPRDHTGVLDLRPLQLHEDNGLFGA